MSLAILFVEDCYLEVWGFFSHKNFSLKSKNQVWKFPHRMKIANFRKNEGNKALRIEQTYKEKLETHWLRRHQLGPCSSGGFCPRFVFMISVSFPLIVIAMFPSCN